MLPEKFIKEYLKPPLVGVGITRDANQEFALYVTMAEGAEGSIKELDGINIVYATLSDDVRMQRYCGN